MRHAALAGLFALGIAFAGSASPREYRVLAIRVDFPYEDPDHETTTGRGKFDLRDYASDPAVRAQYANPWDIPPHDKRYFSNHLAALGNYWSAVSEDSVTLRSRILPDEPRGAYTMSDIFYKYGNGRTKDKTFRKLVELFREAVESCKRNEGARINFSEYDTFMVIHAGVGKETSDGLNDIPSAYLNAADFQTYLWGPLVIDGIEIDNGIIVPEAASENGIAGLNGILTQMFGHRLGLPSLSNNRDGLPAAGGWALMDTGGMAYGRFTRGFVPTHPCAWSKIELGWITPVTVTSDTTIDVAATHVNNGLPRAVKIPITADEYLLIENRERYAPRDSLPKAVFSDSDTSGVWMRVDHYDALIPGSGILIWHINERIIREKRSSDTLNDDPYRRGVDLLEADGREDIGAPFGFGDPRSEYSEGSDDDTFKQSGRSTLSPVGEPNSGSMWGGNSGVTVTVSSPPGDVMRITISFSPRTLRYNTPKPPGGLTASDLNGDGAEELIASGGDSLVIVDAKNNRSFTVPAGGHPAVVAGIPGGAVLAVPSGDAVNCYGLGDSGLSLLARITAAAPEGSSVVFEGSIVFSGAHLIVPVRFVKNGNTVSNQLLLIPVRDFPNIVTETVALPDTARIISLAAAGVRIAAVSSGGALVYGDAGTKRFATLALPAGTLSAPLIADLDRDGMYEVILMAGSNLLIIEDALGADAAVNNGGAVRTLTIPLPADPVGDPAAADIDSDGRPELLVSTANGLCIFRAGGVSAEGYPISPPPGDSGERISSPPIIGDFDGDGRPDTAFATSNMRMLAYSTPSTVTRKFPITLADSLCGSPLVFRESASGGIALAYLTHSGDLYVRNLMTASSNSPVIWPMWRGGAGLASSLQNEDIPAPVKLSAPFRAFCYPNPITGGSGTFRFVPDAPTDCRITVYSADGRKVFESYLPENRVMTGVPNEVRMDASRLASGLYLARIRTRTHTEICKVGVMR